MLPILPIVGVLALASTALALGRRKAASTVSRVRRNRINLARTADDPYLLAEQAAAAKKKGKGKGKDDDPTFIEVVESAVVGAVEGAVAGSAVPGIGTVGGAVAGGTVGAVKKLR